MTVIQFKKGEYAHDFEGDKTRSEEGSQQPNDPVKAPSSIKWHRIKPLPNGLLRVSPFQSYFMPDVLAPWVDDIAERMQCAPEFVGVSAMISAGAVIGRKVAIKPQQKSDWMEVANLWGMVIGRPGILKSPAMKAAMALLGRLEIEARDRNNDAMQRYRQELKLHKVRKKIAEKSIEEAIKNGAQPTAADLAALDEPQPPESQRYIIHDTTYEALGEILASNPNGVMAFRDEIVALLKTLDRDENAAARAFFMQAWSGTQGYTFDRIIRGHTHIDAACLGLLGSIQPGAFRRM
jgi:hypothetical protein